MAGDFPSAVYLIAEQGKIVSQSASGRAVVEPETIRAKVDTIYDLASLTKVMVTGLLAARLFEQGELKLDDRCSLYLSEFDIEGKKDLTIQNLLVHTSRLPAWKPLYLCAAAASNVINEIAETPVNTKQANVTYSDLNFITLGIVIERIMDKGLDRAAEEMIFRALDLESTFFDPRPGLKQRIAASEKGNVYERQICIEQGYLQSEPQNSVAIAADSAPFRTNQIWGEVHDNNAYFMGGVAGHAGLFATAEETCKIAQQFLPNYTTLLKPETCELFRTNFTPGMNEDRSFAFQLASTKDSTAGTKMSPQSFGHLGFTGTSVWIDPVKERVFILLTNRTHNHVLPFTNINAVRRKFHDLAVELLEKY